MAVSMVQIRIMRVGMHERRVLMAMGMRFSTVPGFVVFVLMMFVVPVGVIVDQTLVAMNMHMSLSNMQPHPNRHHSRCNPEHATRPLGENNQRHRRTEERCNGKIGARPGSTEVSQCPDKKAQTYPYGAKNRILDFKLLHDSRN